MPTVIVWEYDGTEETKHGQQRAWPNDDVVDDLMVWHRHASNLPCEKVPVQAILEEFHELSGAKGRYAHRGQAPPPYNFTVKEEAGSSGV